MFVMSENEIAVIQNPEDGTKHPLKDNKAREDISNIETRIEALESALESVAKLNSPALVGYPTTVTPIDDADVKQIANVEYVKQKVGDRAKDNRFFITEDNVDEYGTITYKIHATRQELIDCGLVFLYGDIVCGGLDEDGYLVNVIFITSDNKSVNLNNFMVSRSFEINGIDFSTDVPFFATPEESADTITLICYKTFEQTVSVKLKTSFYNHSANSYKDTFFYASLDTAEGSIKEQLITRYGSFLCFRDFLLNPKSMIMSSVKLYPSCAGALFRNSTSTPSSWPSFYVKKNENEEKLALFIESVYAGTDSYITIQQASDVETESPSTSGNEIQISQSEFVGKTVFDFNFDEALVKFYYNPSSSLGAPRDAACHVYVNGKILKKVNVAGGDSYSKEQIIKVGIYNASDQMENGDIEVDAIYKIK